MRADTLSVRFLYGTRPGRAILQWLLKSRADRLAVGFLRSGWSRPVVGWYARRHNIPLDAAQKKSFRSFGEFFVRTRPQAEMDMEPGHLISPCDGWLSAYPIGPDSSFSIKGSRYRLEDLLQDEELAPEFHGGLCLIFRLCPQDYHHFCYIDDGSQGEAHHLPGTLHSVQPLACETYPVYTLNRRCWCLLKTEHFGPVVQTEVGAMIVGGICHERENGRVYRGQEMGRFELAGSTIVLLFQKGRASLLPELAQRLEAEPEVRVRQGMQIGLAADAAEVKP